MPCMCGDICCPSCGPAQGYCQCGVCGAWDSEGGCEDPQKCEDTAVEWARLEADDWMVVWNAGSWEPGPFDTTYPSGNGYPEPLAIHVQQAVAERLACIAQALDDESAEDYLREVVAALRGIAHLCPLNTDPKQSFEDD